MAAESEFSRALLFVDLLGSKAIWQRGGADAAADAFDAFADLIGEAIEAVGVQVEALIESDSAAVLCPDPATATKVGVALFRHTFMGQSVSEEKESRTWIRGVIVDGADVEKVADLRSLAKPTGYEGLSVVRLSRTLLEAVSMEKSGFKGMRLLIDGQLLSNADRRELAGALETKPVVPFKRLAYTDYPKRTDGFEDVLWMASDDLEVANSRRRRMATRMRLAARVPEELAQAAATQVVFDECLEIADSSRAKARKSASRVVPRSRQRAQRR